MNQSRVIDSNSVVCHVCGRSWRHLSDFQDLRPLGLALKASCPVCGTQLGVNSLWHRTSLQVNNDRQKNHSN